ncbi:aromatic amino acid ammonia-lyase [Pectobacterium aroidearum]|uniref:HAL/PAL/TAL family ammonia-lyase n=1 Tax=Pectobacterium aroidearum TaxID=1201031 RepID=UPI003158D276
MPINEGMTSVVIKPEMKITINDVYDVACRGKRVELSEETLTLLHKDRHQLERKINDNQLIYGVNTGFGGNSRRIVPAEQAAEHQNNLLAFLSAGTGEYFPVCYVRAAQFLTLLAITRGWSAVRPEVANILAAHINSGIIPDVPRFGSVGASGDLIPSSYIANAICGRGNVVFGEQRMPALEAITLAGLHVVELQSKEGLALVNGTRMMTAVASLTCRSLDRTYRAALAALALTAEALEASVAHYDERIQKVKGHPGQIAVGKILRSLLSTPQKNSHLASDKETVDAIKSTVATTREEEAQEVYSLRCAPQILGVVAESIASACAVVEREAVSVNDNPLIDPENGDILHGGNFMGNHIARTMDGLKLDIALVANHMHSLMALLMDSRFSKGLPNSLSPENGIGHGFKGTQLSQTALVAHIRWGSSPSSVHTLPTEQFNQDIVSLGLHSAQTAAELEVRLRDVVSINILAACQAIDIRSKKNALSGPLVELYSAVRRVSPMLTQDRALDKDIAAVSHLIADGLPLPDCIL